MLRRLSETFTATHLTIMFGLAVLAPTALIAVPAYQSVVVTDARTGTSAYVDASRRLIVYDPIAGFQNYPGTLVHKNYLSSAGSQPTSGNFYTVPAGKALIMRAVSGVYQDTAGNGAISLFLICKDPSCNTPLTGFAEATPGYHPLSISFGTGLAVPAGTRLYIYNYNSYSNSNIHGYLVPAGSVPATGSAAAAELEGPPQADAVKKRLGVPIPVVQPD